MIPGPLTVTMCYIVRPSWMEESGCGDMVDIRFIICNPKKACRSCAYDSSNEGSTER